jgi:uncharacterized protein (DUF433 family)
LEGNWLRERKGLVSDAINVMLYLTNTESEYEMPVPEPLITSSPDRMSGTPVFAGTRVPVQTLIDYLEAGDPLDEFLKDFPSVSREHAIAVLELAKSALIAKAAAA